MTPFCEPAPSLGRRTRAHVHPPIDGPGHSRVFALGTLIAMDYVCNIHVSMVSTTFSTVLRAEARRSVSYNAWIGRHRSSEDDWGLIKGRGGECTTARRCVL